MVLTCIGLHYCLTLPGSSVDGYVCAHVVADAVVGGGLGGLLVVAVATGGGGGGAGALWVRGHRNDNESERRGTDKSG